MFPSDEIKRLCQPLLEKGFDFEYLYEKGGDSSCSYICRFKKGRDYFDWRELSGGNEITFITFINGDYDFPSLKSRYPKEYRSFALKHLLKRASLDEKRKFTAKLLALEAQKPDFFGIKL